jgi:heme/copper-type cytochrome/quinol oxidase subunit 2
MKGSKASLGRFVYGALIAVAALVVAFAPMPDVSHPRPGDRLVRIDAGQFSYSPSVIDVHPGDVVTIQLVSTDVVHGLYVDGYDISVQADPGQTKTLTFVADRPGSFRIRCNVTCGAMHPFMIGKLQVGDDALLVRSIGLAFVGVIGLVLFPASDARPVGP